MRPMLGARRLPPGVRPYQTDPSGQTLSPYLTFDQVSGEPLQGSIGAGIEETLAGEPPAEELPIHPLGAAPRGKPAPEAQQEEPQSYPSEEEAALRYKSGQQMASERLPVHGPWEAAANAVNQIVGTYQQKRATREVREAKERRQKTMQGALTGNTDINTIADAFMQSGDPDLVDQGLNLKLQIAAQQAKGRSAPTIREFVNGDQVEYRQFDPQTGQWTPMGGVGGPRYKPAAAGGGGASAGPDEEGSYHPTSQGSPHALPNGQVVQAAFVKGYGFVYAQDDGKGGVKYVPLPAGARPVTTGTGGALPPSAWLKLRQDRQAEVNGLKALDQYLKVAGGLPQGMQRWANSVAGRARTFFGKEITPDQFNQMDASSKAQALLGMFRTTVVGPGVMTEQDALRVLNALGGDPISALQNPQVMQRVLGDIYARKYENAQVLDDEYKRNAPYFGEQYEPMGVPPQIGSPTGSTQQGAQQQPQQGAGQIIRYDAQGRRIK
jgi:hypothetical protein